MPKTTFRWAEGEQEERGGSGDDNGAPGVLGEDGGASGPDVFGLAVSSDHDLIGDSSGNLGFSTAHGDILNPSSVGLGPLADNGGPTQTMALLGPTLTRRSSPAINAGDSTAPGLAATDQRGYARIVGSAVDIGAYEFGATPATTDLSISGTAPAFVSPGGQITYNLTVTNNSATDQSNVILADELPAHTTLVSWTPAAGWSSSAPAAGSGSGTVTAWIASLAANSSANFTLVVQVAGGTASDTVITDTASVGPIAGDPNPANNSVTLQTAVEISPAPEVVAYYVLFGSEKFNLIGSTRFDLPWQITGIQVVFSESIASGDVNSLTGLTTTGFSGLGTNTLTWTIAPVKIGKIATLLQGSGADALKDTAGDALDDGAGFALNFNVLEGDANDDGVVSSADMIDVYNATNQPYSIFDDINGDGVVTMDDVSLVRQLIGNHL